jgi:hypothetical protein
MDRNINTITRLSNLPQKFFRPDELEKMKIYQDELEDLVRKELLKVDKSKQYPDWIYYLPDSAYMIIIAKETQKTNEANWKISNSLLVVTILLAVLAVIQIVLAVMQIMRF